MDDYVFHHQVERKRHIGNDIVNIVFVECESNKAPAFRPSMVKTHFTRILMTSPSSRIMTVIKLNNSAISGIT